MGGDLGGTGETVPSKFEVWGTASVIGCVSKYEVNKNGVMEEFLFTK